MYSPEWLYICLLPMGPTDVRIGHLLVLNIILACRNMPSTWYDTIYGFSLIFLFSVTRWRHVTWLNRLRQWPVTTLHQATIRTRPSVRGSMHNSHCIFERKCTWWRHDMKFGYALLANLRIGAYFVISLNKLLDSTTSCRWFETSWR